LRQVDQGSDSALRTDARALVPTLAARKWAQGRNWRKNPSRYREGLASYFFSSRASVA
jgi:hypothetical protein